MESNNIQASSILSLFQTNNEQRQSFVAQIIDSIKNGKLSALNVHLQLKCMGIISEMITEDKAFKEAIQKDGVNVPENQEIKVTKCDKCPMFSPYLHNPILDGECMANRDIDIYNSNDMPENCPLKGKSITYKIGESNE